MNLKLTNETIDRRKLNSRHLIISAIRFGYNIVFSSNIYRRIFNFSTERLSVRFLPPCTSDKYRKLNIERLLLYEELKPGGRNYTEKNLSWNQNFLKILKPEPNENFYLNIVKTGTGIGSDIFKLSVFGSFWFFWVPNSTHCNYTMVYKRNNAFFFL